MQEIIDYVENKGKFIKIQKVDGWQGVANSFILSSYFPWICLILLLNRNNWRKPVIYVLLINWFLRAIGDALKFTMQTRPIEPNTFWPHSQTNWYISHVLAHFFWFSGEIVGDWYPLLRIKAITFDKKKMKLVYFTCITYNITKVLAMLCGLISNPIDIKRKDDNSVSTDDLTKYNLAWWSTIMFMQIASYFYDLSIIIALKSTLYDKLKDFKEYNSIYMVLKKFKQISEYRIIFSMIASLTFLPFVTLFVVLLFLKYYHINSTTSFSYIESDVQIEHLRIVVLNFNYALMHIDQILLKFYVDKVPKQKDTYLDLTLNTSAFQNYEDINDMRDYLRKNNHPSNPNVITISTNSNNSNSNYFSRSVNSTNLSIPSSLQSCHIEKNDEYYNYDYTIRQNTNNNEYS